MDVFDATLNRVEVAVARKVAAQTVQRGERPGRSQVLESQLVSVRAFPRGGGLALEKGLDLFRSLCREPPARQRGLLRESMNDEVTRLTVMVERDHPVVETEDHVGVVELVPAWRRQLLEPSAEAVAEVAGGSTLERRQRREPFGVPGR